MLDKDQWIPALTGKLREAFGDRLLFVGLQGSYRRGEATERSDIDVVVVLDRLEIEDLETYRTQLDSMPENEKACGFVSGAAELLHWPKYEIFQMVQETQPCLGSLEGLVPDVARQDVEESLRIGAANLYHAACHIFLYDDPTRDLEILRDAYKSSFFLLQLLHYLRSGHYARSKKELLPLLEESERKILELGMDWDGCRPEREAYPDALFRRLIAWSGGILRGEAY